MYIYIYIYICVLFFIQFPCLNSNTNRPMYSFIYRLCALRDNSEGANAQAPRLGANATKHASSTDRCLGRAVSGFPYWDSHRVLSHCFENPVNIACGKNITRFDFSCIDWALRVVYSKVPTLKQCACARSYCCLTKVRNCF